MQRTNFNYHKATITEIADYFKLCSRQCISATRFRCKTNHELGTKVEQAYKQYKIDQIMNKDTNV